MILQDGVLRNDEEAIFRLLSLYRAHGYSRFKMSKFEEYDLYVRNKSFLVSDNIITFTDTNGKLMALKPDVTLSIVKNLKDEPKFLQKVYYNENVYRVSERNKAYREIMQVGLECLGTIDVYCIAEVLTLAAESLAVISPDCVLDISHLGIVSGAVDALGVSLEGRQEILSCVGQKNLHGIDSVCLAEGIDPDKASLLKKLVGCYGEPKKVFSELLPLLEGTPMQKAAQDLKAILSAVPCEKIHIDFSVINDMNYYNGIVFKGFVNGIPTGVLSGGQYDNLMRKMGKSSGAIGFAVYMDLLEELAEPKEEYDVDAVILYGDDTDLTSLSKAVHRLAEQGLRVSALRALPEKLTCRQLFTIDKSEVILVENHAEHRTS